MWSLRHCAAPQLRVQLDPRWCAPIAVDAAASYNWARALVAACPPLHRHPESVEALSVWKKVPVIYSVGGTTQSTERSTNSIVYKCEFGAC